MMWSVCRYLACVAVLGLLAGCSPAAPSDVVRGTVTLDGAPLPDGLIDFVAIDGSSPTVTAKISAGSFDAAVPPGEKRVEIRAPKVTGKKKAYDTPDSPTVDIVAELLPARYNQQSELRMTVAEGEQEKMFELTSK